MKGFIALICVFSAAAILSNPSEATPLLKRWPLVRSFTSEEFRADYSLLTSYKRGSGRDCPKKLSISTTGFTDDDGYRTIPHTDMKIDGDDCTDDGALRLQDSLDVNINNEEDLLAGFRSAEAVRLWYQLDQQLPARQFWASVSDSRRRCGKKKWFDEGETFFFFDEDKTVFINITTTGRPQKVDLIGYIRYMLVIRDGITCIYRVKLDVDAVNEGKPRVSPSPISSPSPSSVPIVSPSPSAAPAPSSSASPMQSPSTSPGPSITPEASSSTSATPSPRASLSPTTSPSSFPSPSESPEAFLSNSPDPSSSASTSTSLTPSATTSPSSSSSPTDEQQNPSVSPAPQIPAPSPSESPVYTSIFIGTSKPGESPFVLEPSASSTPVDSASASPSETASESIIPSSSPVDVEPGASTPSPTDLTTPSASFPDSTIPTPSVSQVSSPSPSTSLGSLDTSGGNQVGSGGDEDDDEVGADGSSTCFPASARIMVGHGECRRMDEIKVGDKVMGGNGNLTEVFMFTHRDASKKYKFLRFRFDEGNALILTSSHYVYLSNGNMRPAEEIRNGDTLATPKGSGKEVVSIESVWDIGLFNPHTLTGDLVVEGIRTTCYTSAIQPRLAHGLLAPLRFVWRIARVDLVRGLFKHGCALCNSA